MDTNWSCYVYIAADNDLQNAVDQELNEIGSGDPSKVKVVVQVDRTGKRTERRVLDFKGFNLLPPRRFTFGNDDSGLASTLAGFIRASFDLARGKYTTVILNGHGTGITQVKLDKLGSPKNGNGHGNGNGNGHGFFARLRDAVTGVFQFLNDDTSHHFLDNNELVAALQKPLAKNTRYDILGFDACLMGMVEIAYQVRDLGTFLVASQDNEATAGWPYDKVLNTSFSNTTSAGAAAHSIVENYDAATNTDPDATLSAVALGVMENVANTLDHLGGALLPVVRPQIKPLAKARQSARTFANFDSIDLYGFLGAIRKELGEAMSHDATWQAIDDAAASAMAAVKQAVINYTKKDADGSGAHGLAVYIPNAPVVQGYDALPFCKAAPHWRDFVTAYGAYR